jgi:hypothetical protein
VAGIKPPLHNETEEELKRNQRGIKEEPKRNRGTKEEAKRELKLTSLANFAQQLIHQN